MNCMPTAGKIVCHVSFSGEIWENAEKDAKSLRLVAEGPKNEKGHQAFEKDVSRVPGRLS